MPRLKFIKQLVFSLILITVFDASGNADGATSSGLSQGSLDGITFMRNCLSCRRDGPDYKYCNIDNVAFACCPPDSEDFFCQSNSNHNITCTGAEPAPELYYSYCPRSEENLSKCGSSSKEKVLVSREPVSV